MRSIFVIAFAAVVTGCVFFDVAEQQALAEASIHLSGRIDTTVQEDAPLIALLVRWPAQSDPKLVDHYVLHRPGEFTFSTSQPGRYSIAAFVDRNRNLSFDPDEPARSSQPHTTFDLGPGESQRDIQVLIDPGDRVVAAAPLDIRGLRAEGLQDRLGTTLGQLGAVGEVVDLADPKFSRDNANTGLWRPFDFMLEVGAGVYFLEPFNPERVPVLFVHGIGGSPQDFTYLIDRLDRERFQPWIFYYPSGAKLQKIAGFLSRVMSELELTLDMKRVFVVAHSMGGLVSRAFLLHHTEQTGSEALRLFVTLSTPWNGHAGATLGVKYAPEVVYSWRDVAPGSAFLTSLFYRDGAAEARRRLPAFLPHHLIFGFRRDDNLPGICNDKVVSVASELREEAQKEAVSVYGFDADHVEILRLPAAADRLNRMLAAALDRIEEPTAAKPQRSAQAQPAGSPRSTGLARLWRNAGRRE
ncbi:MAG: putative lipase [bacterium]|nr:putative lipase [bacterium]